MSKAWPSDNLARFKGSQTSPSSCNFHAGRAAATVVSRAGALCWTKAALLATRAAKTAADNLAMVASSRSEISTNVALMVRLFADATTVLNEPQNPPVLSFQKRHFQGFVFNFIWIHSTYVALGFALAVLRVRRALARSLVIMRNKELRM